MSNSAGLTGAPLRAGLDFNWVFLVELAVCGILAIFFLFYFNRVFASIVSYGLRAWTWHRYRVYIDIQALQISLLGGRVFFKGLRYHGNNETILIHSGFITWCYWLRNARKLDVSQHTDLDAKQASAGGKPGHASLDGEALDGRKDRRQLPCRLNVSLSGVEWFVYNRSAAYDAIVAGLVKEEDQDDYESPSGEQHKCDGNQTNAYGKLGAKSSHFNEAGGRTRSASESIGDTPLTEKSSLGIDGNNARLREFLSTSGGGSSERAVQDSKSDGAFILRLLPIHVHCVKAAVVLGNEHTRSILIAKADRADGEIGATNSTVLDQYRQLINFIFEHPVVQMKPNEDFKEDQKMAASRVRRGDGGHQAIGQHHIHMRSFFHRQRRKVWHKLQDLVPAFRSSVESLSSSMHDSHETPSRPGPDSSRWQGLSRYLDDSEQDDKAKWSAIEYATVSTIADCPEASMSFYWDVVGTVPDRSDSNDRGRQRSANINGDSPPEWGIDLAFKGATINYGPWADRQRADIQRVFFPSLCKNAHPSKHLLPGQFRVPTEFKLSIVFDEETTLRIPVREESKNWKWTKFADIMGARPDEQKRNGKSNRKKKADKGNPGPEIRPFGWLDVKVGANAAITYTMDMIAGHSGFSNKLDLDIPNTEITTSVNHGLLWRSVETRLSCDLSNPLQWNTQRTWRFDVNSNGLELFILREHVFLLLDLVDDWASGPPPEYLTFVPFQYLVNLHLGDFRLYLNVNDSNIINNPSDFDDNTYIIIFGAVLNAAVHIPLKNYRPHRNDISFEVKAKRGGLNLHLPPWNTQATFLSSMEIASLKELNIDGTYQYCSTTSSSNTDILLLNVHGRAPSALFYGFVIRYFLKLKDNYFGDDIRFKTLDEYQDVLRARREGGEEYSLLPPHKKSNDLDVILSIVADESSVILPSNLYSAKNHIRIDIATLAADLRFTNYYMDLDCALGSLAFSHDSEASGVATPISMISSTQLFVDGLKFSGNRLFGLPPTEPTYMCNWDFTIGTVTGECTLDFLTRLASSSRAFAFSFDDDENALPSISEVILHDVTFLAASVDSVHIWLHVEEAAFLLSTAAISITFNDWAGSHYSKKVKLLIPDVNLGCVDAESASRHKSRSQHAVETHAFLQTSFSFTMIQRKPNFKEDRQLQQEHIKCHDQRTHRTDFLLYHGLCEETATTIPTNPPAQWVPPIPLPVVQHHLDQLDKHSFSSRMSSSREGCGKHIIGRKSSFLAPSNSSLKGQESILRPRSSLRMTQNPAAESRSRSLHTSAGREQEKPPREHSTSTGRQSSFYSALGESRGRAPITISSSCIPPNFPLEGVELDNKNLPRLSEPFHLDQSADPNQLDLDGVRPDRVDGGCTHISFIVEFPAGVSGFLNPEAVHAVADLLSAFQAVDPNDLLDDLQIDCMNEIFDMKRQKSLTGEVFDLSVRVSEIGLRFLNSSTSQKVKHSHQDVLMLDQYDVSISGLAFTSRSETSAVQFQSEETAQISSVAHISLRTAGLAAKERYSDIDDPQAAVHGALEDVIFWYRQNHETSASVAFKAFEIATNSSKLEYLASLLHRTEVLGNDLAVTFTNQIQQQQNRVRLFTYLVATAGQQAPDPLFLTRPSYVLRSAPEHLRTTDSWKVVTRLHHMYSSLNISTQDEIISRLLNETENVPPDAGEKVRAGFDQWRSWDLNNMKTCRVMARVYGSESATEAPILSPKPLKVSFKTENIRLVLDPGPKQNEISLADISASFESTASVSTTDIDPHAVNEYMECLVVQMFCADMAISLNWELCELTEDILKLYHGNPPSSSFKDKPQVASNPEKDRPKRKIHILLATDKGSITFDTINVLATSLSEGLKASIILFENAEDGLQLLGCLMLAAEATTSTIKSHSQNLSVFQMRSPSVYASYESRCADHGSINAAKIAANCQQLSFFLKQDVLALIEVLDLFIGDEVLQLSSIKKRMRGWSDSEIKLSTPPRKSAPTTISIALFLDEYHISVPLLQSLTYDVSGVVARASIAARLGSEIIFDFDIKENSHDIQTVVDDMPKSISLLQLPPTNGRITSHMSDEENTISIIASVEPVELDAAALHSLLTALNRPEISSVVSDVQEDLKLVQSHIRELFGSVGKTMSPTEKSIGTPLAYDAHFTLAGLDIFANAQGQDGERNSARLDLNLGCIQFVLANRLESDGLILEFPELRVSLRQVMFELSRWNNGTMEPCGNLAFAAHLIATSKTNETGNEVRSFHVNSDGLEINLFADTASSVVDVVGHLQDKIKDLDLSREKQYLRKLRKSKPRIAVNEEQEQDQGSISGTSIMFGSMYSLELLNIHISWLVGTYEENQTSLAETDNLVLSLKRIDLSTKKANAARLTIEDLQLQMVPASQDKMQRSLNSALLPEVIFNVGFVSTADSRRLAFQAAGKSLDLRLTSQFIIPASALQKSITSASEKLRSASATWSTAPPGPRVETPRRQPFFGKKRMESLLVDADFAGAVVYLSGKKLPDHGDFAQGIKPGRATQAGRYGQFTHADASNNTILRAPGLAWKIEYKDSGMDDPSLNAEVKVDASTNILYPSVVPLIMEISSTVKEVVSDEDPEKLAQAKTSPQKFMVADEDNILTADPSAVLGRTRLNLGLRICRQEFSLSCQPIARVAATARFDDIYITINTVRSTEHGHFFAASAAFTRLQASVQHVYSRESTASFDVESVFLSLMNSKHVSGISGISAILKISPMKVLVNAKQLQDFLLFREIWVPPEIRQNSSSSAATANPTLQSQTYLVQRYQQVAATGAFPWNATVSIAELDVQLDLGQAIGKSAFIISNFWISSKKNSDWEQNLCLGFDKIGINSSGRMSGFVALQNFKVRTSIQWPAREMALNQTPLVQGSMSFSQLRIKAAFDYQAFLMADVTSLKFMMYNVRNSSHAKGDRLVAILDGESVQVFCTTTSASQGLALYQAFQRLVQEKRANYEASLSEIEKYMKRKSSTQPATPLPKTPSSVVEGEKASKSPISLHTDVIVTLKAVNVGAFPNTFLDHQVFKLEALDAQARFAVTMDEGQIHSILGLTLGQLRIGLAGVKKVEIPKSVGEISVEDVVSSATGSRGGTILKVPKVEATMQTWQVPNSNHIDYVFKSSFEGKVEVGWNYSRIGYIRGMWAAHSKALAQRLGKPLAPSAVKITGVPDEEGAPRQEGGQQKITAEVNVPQSKYDYTALEPPIIETPQLRDMGEATPPLEWIGLHRERLPNLTHQIVIVTLLELASEVEDAYGKILGK